MCSHDDMPFSVITHVLVRESLLVPKQNTVFAHDVKV